MALLKYLKKRSTLNPVVLPDENGPLCKDVPSSSIREANLEVSEVLETARKLAGKLTVSENYNLWI